MAKTYYCNACGKQMNTYERYGHISFNQSLGYASKYDGEYIEIDFCPECFDNLIDELVIPPFSKN